MSSLAANARVGTRGAKLRVALVTPALDASGGIGRVMSYALDELPSGEVDVRVLDTRGHSLNPLASIWPLLVAWLRLIGLALTHRVDVAHVNISASGSTVRKSLVIWTCRALRLPVVVHLHASSYPDFFDGLRPTAQAFVRRTFGAADRVVVLGSFWSAYARDVLAVREERLLVLPNAVPGPETAEPIERAAGEPLQLLFLGRLGARKGVPEILAALASPALRDEPWAATIAGDGDVEEYRAQAADLGLGERTEFPGWVGAAESQALLRTAHVLLLPSHAEGLPISVLESLAHALPVVTTPVGSIPDVVSDGVEGLLVEPGDVEALGSAVLTLLRDEEHRRELGRNARRTWERGFAARPYAARLVELWSEASCAA